MVKKYKIMNTLFYKSILGGWLALFLMLMPVAAFADTDPGNVDDDESAAMAKTKQNAPTLQETDPNGANYLAQRRALVGKHCAVNRVINVVAVGTGTSGLEPHQRGYQRLRFFPFSCKRYRGYKPYGERARHERLLCGRNSGGILYGGVKRKQRALARPREDLSHLVLLRRKTRGRPTGG